jgi:hypothetical protein
MAQQLAGRTYFSMTTKQGVEEYIKQRTKDMEAGLIVKGRLTTIKTHLAHWLNYVNKDTKLKEMERTDCENYFHNRTKNKKKYGFQSYSTDDIKDRMRQEREGRSSSQQGAEFSEPSFSPSTASKIKKFFGLSPYSREDKEAYNDFKKQIING